MHPAAVTALRQHLPLPWRDTPHRHAEPAAQAWLVDDDHAVAVLTMLAHVAWQQGNGAVARVALDRARAANPGYFLAALLDRVVAEGMCPRAM